LLLAAALLAAALAPPLVAGFPSKVLALALFALAALAVATIRGGGASARAAPRRDAGLGALAYGLAALVAMPFARQIEVAGAAMPTFAAVVALHFAAQSAFAGEGAAAARRTLLAAAIVGPLVVAVFGLAAQRHLLAAGDTAGLGEAARAGRLATPFFEHSYLAAQSVVAAAPLAAALAILRGPLPARLGAALALAAGGAFAFATQSRAGILAWFLGVAFTVTLLVLARPRRAPARRDAQHRSRNLRRVAAAVVVAAIAIVTALAVLPQGARDRFAQLLDPQLTVFNFMRALVWEDALRIIGAGSPFGIGPGCFGLELSRIHLAARPVAHAHDQLLHTLAEIGIVGLFGLVLMWCAPLVAACNRGAVAREPLLVPAFAGSLVATIAFSIFESPLAFAGAAAPFAVFSGALAARTASDGESSLVPSSPVRRFAPLALVVAMLAFAAPPAYRHAASTMLADRASRALAAGDLDAAYRLAIAAETRSATPPEILTVRARVEKARRDPAAALATYRRHEAILPGLPDHLFEIAVLELELGRPLAATAPLLAAARRAPRDSRLSLRFELAKSLYRGRRYEAARLVLSELYAANYHVVDPGVLKRLAETFLNLGREFRVVQSLLERYAEVVPEAERRYAFELLENLRVRAGK
jgi:O-antigen ligase